MKSFIAATWTVYLKEVRENLRHRRVLFNALMLGPLMGPLLFLVILRLAVAQEVEQAEKPLPVAIIGIDLAPTFVDALRQSGIEVRSAPTDPRQAIQSQELDLVLEVTDEFAADFRAGRSAQVNLYYDSSRREVGAQVQRLRAAIAGYAQTTAGLRLVARGLSPTLVAPIIVADRDQATAQGRGAMVFAMLPYFLVLAAFMGGMSLAIDATAGERERQSLEPLLINPVSSSAILSGKLAAISSFSLTSIAMSLCAFAVSGHYLPEHMGNTVALNANFALHALPLMIPLAVLISILQTVVTSFSRTFREAQTWLGLIQLVPMIPSILLAILPFKAQWWAYSIPLVGQQLALLRLLRGEAVTATQFGICTLATTISVVALYQLATRIYASERLTITQ